MKTSTTILAALLAISTSVGANPLVSRSDDNNNNRGKHCGHNGNLPSDKTKYTGSDIFAPVSVNCPSILKWQVGTNNDDMGL